MSQPFFDAVRSGDIDRLRSLVESSPDVVRAVFPRGEAPGEVDGGTALHLAVQAGDPELVELLLDLGADLEARNAAGRTALHDSIEYGKSEVRRTLIERGAQIDICAAAILGLMERLRELLDREPELVNDRSTDLSPLGWASYGNQAEVARELISRGARMDDGELLCAASVGHVEVGRVLLEFGADPNEIDGHAGGNALHAAACMRYTHDSSRFVSMLLAAGADPSIRTRDGKTALELAEEGDRRQATRSNDGTAEDCVRNFEAVAALLREAYT